MAIKPENTFIASVHKYLKQVYFEKMFNPYRSGTPDVWYSGNKSDMWIEYKFLQKLPVRSAIVLGLTDLQKKWLRDRYYEGRKVFVICGSKNGGVVFTDLTWEKPITVNDYQKRLQSRQDLAIWIHNQLSVELYDTSKSTSNGVKVRKSSLQNCVKRNISADFIQKSSS